MGFFVRLCLLFASDCLLQNSLYIYEAELQYKWVLANIESEQQEFIIFNYIGNVK